MRFIPVTHLKGEEVIAINISNANMQILVRKGSKLSQKMISRIRQYGIHSVYIEDDFMKAYCEEDLKDTIKPQLRNTSVFNIKTSFDRFQSRVSQQKKSLKYGKTGEALFQDIKNISSDLIQEIIYSKNTKVAMNDLKTLIDYQYEHSVNVAVLSLIIGVELGLSPKELEDLAYGALLIDVGSQGLNNQLLQKPRPYTHHEKEEIQKHVDMGYDYVNGNTLFNGHVKNIVLQHHERLNGSGYPKGLLNEDIHPLAKIVMIADVYDALTSDRPYRAAYRQHEAVEYIMAHADSLFDFKIANVFSRKIVPYPIGTYVLLSNEQKGIVTRNNPNHPLRPIIRTFGQSSITHTNAVSLNLLEVNNVVIDKIIYSIT